MANSRSNLIQKRVYYNTIPTHGAESSFLFYSRCNESRFCPTRSVDARRHFLGGCIGISYQYLPLLPPPFQSISGLRVKKTAITCLHIPYAIFAWATWCQWHYSKVIHCGIRSGRCHMTSQEKVVLLISAARQHLTLRQKSIPTPRPSLRDTGGVACHYLATWLSLDKSPCA